MAKKKVLMDEGLLNVVIQRLCHQLVENYSPFEKVILIGLQPRGVDLLQRLSEELKNLYPNFEIPTGVVDPTFFRDDFRRGDKQLLAHPTKIPVNLDGYKVILVDDVLFTGRTIRAGLEAILEYGRPASIDLLVLINRKFSRQLPIEPIMIGKSVDHYDGQKVRVIWKNQENTHSEVLLAQE
jgi:pyrimidine operon attenuation protein/uracil phosphoribosyltransferase